MRLFLFRVLVCVFAFQLFSHGLLAGTGQWTTSGPEGGTVDSLAGDPTNPDIVFAGMDGSGVFKSEDAGTTWRSTTLDTGGIIAIQIDPVQPANVFAASTTSLFKSTDGGETWRAIGPNVPGSIQCLTIDPLDPSVLYAGALESNPLDAGNSTGLYRSVDDGENWELTSLHGVVVEVVAVDPKNNSILYAGIGGLFPSAKNGLGVWKSTDRGATWTPNDSLAGFPPVSTIVIDPLQPTNLYASWVAGFIYKSTDAGATWKQIVGAPVGISSALLIDPSTPSTLYFGSYFGVFKSIDGAENWFSLPGISAYVFSMTLSPSQPQRLFAGHFHSDPFGRAPGPPPAFRSDDAGQTWTQASDGLINSLVRGLAIDPLQPDHLYAATDFGGFWESLDGGSSWQPIEKNLHGILGALGIDPTSGSRLFAQYDFQSYSGLVRSIDGGRTWEAT